jgi:hypothetical protein
MKKGRESGPQVVRAEGKKFRAAILVRVAFVCYWCGGEAGSVDYLRALVDGGSLSTSQTQWLLVFGATFDAARE